jgi:hypothetical protein
VNRSDFDRKFFDFDLYGTANLGRNLGRAVRYRSVTLNYDIDSDAGDLKLKGPYFGSSCASSAAFTATTSTELPTGIGCGATAPLPPPTFRSTSH